ncbi:MAD2 [Candida pseudojiufengensis]|uniref:MAD2 n=1 Tax=Candida pseudojiufengensis TaxID=497109 RepID=UPI002224EACE|nr:MAD2 [Candida pseudojiufengensis]KAI5960361.1 MAD2 [Candida pseudojiufengensis]
MSSNQTTNIASSSSSSQKLALKGSSKIVSDYFEFAINSILYQRGIYPQEDFQIIKKYDLPMIIINDEDVSNYIQNIMKQLKKWIYGKKITKLIVVIISKSTGENLERWEFNIETKDDDDNSHEGGKNESKAKSEIQKEIRAIIRQITSSSTFLPILKNDEYTFNVLVYTDLNSTNNIPIQWLDTHGDGRHLIGNNIDKVEFSSFSTDLHKVNTSVSYKFE